MNCAFIFGVIILFTAIRYQTGIKTEKENVQDLMDQVAGTNTNQMALLLDEMDRQTLNIAVSSTVQKTLKMACNYKGDQNFFDLNRDERRELIQMLQQMAGMSMKDTSINIVSAEGDYMLLDLYVSVMANREEIRQVFRMEEFEGDREYKFIGALEADPYERTDTRMFSYVRKISDEFGTYGYVEIQKTEEILDTIFQNFSDSFEILSVVTLGDGVFYTSDKEEAAWGGCLDALAEAADGNENGKLRAMGESWLVHKTELRQYGITVFTLLPESYYTQRVFEETILLLVQSVILLILMVVLIYLVSKQIYRPVRELREKMEHTELDDIEPALQLSRDADEIEMFNYVFANMMERIRQQGNEIAERKVRELQVSYKALQAQVSPHFLYNTLYLIGLKGDEYHVPEIMDMCSDLTHMLSYCMDMKPDSVPFSDEIEYMENYLHLMKCRYLDKLEYTEEIGEAVREIPVPKFILQPLVENCFSHGFKNCARKTYRIHITIEMQGETGWLLRIEDNGSGFSPEDMRRIEEEMEFVRASINDPDAGFAKEIEGIGLVNTYARLLLGASRDVELRIGSGELEGGLVELTCPAN